MKIVAQDRIPDEQESRVEVYKSAIRKNFRFLKETDKLDDLFFKSITLADGQGFLLPISKLHADDGDLIKKLAEWRAENAFAYPSQFQVTVEGTTNWLISRVLEVEDRLLFLLTDKHGYAIGHLGLANALNNNMEIEIDNVLRGMKKIYPGIMTNAMKRLINWVEETIKPDSLFLRVLYDNKRAIKFYRNLGFKDDKLLPLRKYEDRDSIYYREITNEDNSPPDKYFLRMVYTREKNFDRSEIIDAKRFNQ
jgi:perosamine synthetase